MLYLYSWKHVEEDFCSQDLDKKVDFQSQRGSLLSLTQCRDDWLTIKDAAVIESGMACLFLYGTGLQKTIIHPLNPEK